jgi:hypothetical protein
MVHTGHSEGDEIHPRDLNDHVESILSNCPDKKIVGMDISRRISSIFSPLIRLNIDLHSFQSSLWECHGADLKPFDGKNPRTMDLTPKSRAVSVCRYIYVNYVQVNQVPGPLLIFL